MIGRIFAYNGIRTDADVIPHVDSTDDFGPCTDKDMISDSGRLILFGPDRGLVLDKNIRSSLNTTIDDNSHAVNEDETWPKVSIPSDYATACPGKQFIEQHGEGKDVVALRCLHQSV